MMNYEVEINVGEVEVDGKKCYAVSLDYEEVIKAKMIELGGSEQLTSNYLKTLVVIVGTICKKYNCKWSINAEEGTIFFIFKNTKKIDAMALDLFNRIKTFVTDFEVA